MTCYWEKSGDVNPATLRSRVPALIQPKGSISAELVYTYYFRGYESIYTWIRNIYMREDKGSHESDAPDLLISELSQREKSIQDVFQLFTIQRNSLACSEFAITLDCSLPFLLHEQFLRHRKDISFLWGEGWCATRKFLEFRRFLGNIIEPLRKSNGKLLRNRRRRRGEVTSV